MTSGLQDFDCIKKAVASKTGKKKDRKMMAKPKNVELDQCVIKWYQQQCASGVMVHGTELKMSAERFASNIGLQGFKASEGWLYRFKLRHGLTCKKVYGESLDANEEVIDQYCKEVKDLIQREGLLLEQLYNADETGLYYRSIPENTLASEKEKSVPGRKLCKARVSLLCGANALGSHRLKPLVVGKEKQPRCLRGMMDSLSVHYDHSVKAWFNVKVFKNWIFKHAVPEIVRFQMEVMKVSREQVRALILLDNAPAHPPASELVAKHGRIRVKFLPPNTTSLIQPMDQGIIVAFKRLYRRRFLEEVMVVVDEEERNVGQLTLQNLKNYNLRSVMHNISWAWNDVSSSTLANGWNCLLHRTEPVVDFLGFEADNFHHQFVKSGENTTVDDINN
ncbi:tigger transposable element-derived protein 7-like [Portunus trituberculatus]|uniref:tigger transposable element-derived protein 7-like n=1 Tax=Portunus trituberculatus TaxID=210409 RepID=UPI001E1D1A62|nr:tigger transposable element-derived protein 7-like [Portunus trituberculatus]